MKRILKTVALIAILATALLAVCSVALAEECAHTWKENPATCAKAGTKLCTTCGATEVIPATGNHTFKNAYPKGECMPGTKLCTVCGATENIAAAKDHTWKVGKEATCTADGIKLCTVCGTSEKIAALGHAWKTGKEPTCTAEGIKMCTACGATEKLAMVAHTEVAIPAVAATCTETGLTEGKKCSVCGTVTVAQQTVAALGHKEVAIPAVAATCTETGLTEGKKCSVCGTVTVAQQTVAALGHTYMEKPSTCTVAGMKLCAACGDTVALPLLPHTEVAIPAVAPDCVNTGLTEGKKCSVCGTITVAQETVAALGHKAEVVPAVAPTCTETGLTEGSKCSVCGETLVAQVEVAANGHDYKSYKIAPTTTSKGYTRHVCKVCGDRYKTNWVDKLVVAAPAATVAPTVAPVLYYGDIVTDVEREIAEYVAVIEKVEEEDILVLATVAEADGTFALRNLHLSFELIEALKAEGIEYINFVVGENEVEFALTVFENEDLALVLADMTEEVAGFVLTVDPNAVNEEGKAGCKVLLAVATEEGTEIEVTSIVAGMVLVMEEVEFEVVETKVYVLPEEVK